MGCSLWLETALGESERGPYGQNPLLALAAPLLAPLFDGKRVGLTLKATGTQQAPRSGNLLLCVRVGRPVMPQHVL